MKDTSRYTKGELEVSQPVKLSAVTTDTTNQKSNCTVYGSNTWISELNARRRQKMTQKRSLLTEYNIPNQEIKAGVKYLEDRKVMTKSKAFDICASEIDWNFLSRNLIQKSCGGLRTNPSAYLELDQSMHSHASGEQMLRKISLPNMQEENRFYSCNSDRGYEASKVTGLTSNIGCNYIDMHHNEDALGLSQVTYLPATGGRKSGSGRLDDPAFEFTSPVGWKDSRNMPCYQDVTKNQNFLSVGSLNIVDNLQKSCGVKSAEGDYLFSDTLVQKKRFRLLLDPEKESQLMAEYPYWWSLSEIIVSKYRSLGIPVEVKAYLRQDKDKTNAKAFNISFLNSKDITKALSLGKQGRLFSLLEARPSPTNHVRYEVMHSTGVFEGKCFRHEQIQQLRKGDVVTANQLKGNRVRIIKWCPGGCEMNIDLHGWVLINSSDLDILRRIYWWEAEQTAVKSDSRSNSVKSISQHKKMSSKSQRTVKKKMSFKCNPQRVSPTNCCPFKVLVELEVRRGRKEPAIVGRLKPGDIVWANQHKGSMLRIIRQNQSDKIACDATLNAEVWGWVCLQRRHDEKPRLVRIHSVVTTNKKTGKVKVPQVARRYTGNVHTGHESRNQPRESRNSLESGASRTAEEIFHPQTKKHVNPCWPLNLDMSTRESRYLVESKNPLEFRADKVLISSSADDSNTQVRPGQHQERVDFSTQMGVRIEPSTLEIRISKKFGDEEGQPRSMIYSRSTSPMSIS